MTKKLFVSYVADKEFLNRPDFVFVPQITLCKPFLLLNFAKNSCGSVQP